MFEIRRYSSADEPLWNQFVDNARNSTFLFRREYMDYHAERFDDFSLLFYKEGRLAALLPANRVGTALYSHGGLTYGGMILDKQTITADVCDMFSLLNDYLRQEGVTKVVYKPVPYIYSTVPTAEDLYAIFYQCKAQLSSRLISATLDLQQPVHWYKGHKYMLHKAEANGVTVRRDTRLAEFWQLLEEELMSRHNARPVHSLKEIELLKSRFPDNIIQYGAYKGNELIGGVTFYVCRNVVHCQYIATNALGRKLGALEAIFHRVIFFDYKQFRYLDFGTSNECGGSVLNRNLIFNKEGYGGRGVVYDTYEWNL